MSSKVEQAALEYLNAIDTISDTERQWFSRIFVDGARWVLEQAEKFESKHGGWGEGFDMYELRALFADQDASKKVDE